VVTGTAGTWEVSFVSKGKATAGNTMYTYYTGILKLPVVDNVLNKTDLATDTAYKVVLDQDGKTLYDKQEYALYAISEADANAKLDYTATIINHAIGWAYGISEHYSADEVVESINQFNEVHSSYNQIAANITVLQAADVDLQGQINILTAADTTLDNKIETLKSDIQKLDVTAMQEVVSGHTEQIASLISKTDSLEDKDEELAKADEALGARVTTNEEDIEEINESILAINVQLAETKAVASTNSGNIADHTNKIISLRTDVNEINRVIEPYKSYGDLITGEIEDRVAGDLALQSAIQKEVERATQVANELQNELDATQVDLENTQKDLTQLTETVASNKEAIEKSLEAELKAREAADFNLGVRATELERVTSSHSEEIKSIETRVDSIADDKTVVRNEYILGEPKIFVAKIVLVQPASLEELAQMSHVEYTTEEEKNAFKQELIDAGIITNEQNLENLSAEQVIETLRLKKKTEANTLYLVQEEE
jgi:chromosome segregation ATPase